MSTALAGELPRSPHSGLLRRDAAALIGLTLVAAASVALVGPAADVPIVDDWTYAWSVEHLLTTGEMRVLDWSAHYPLAQILWGAAAARILGFSFGALRVSTLVLAWVGACSFYLILRRARLDRGTSLLGAALLWFNPLFFVLAHSFMTDVPFVTAALLALLACHRWSRGGGMAPLGMWTVLVTTAFLIRQLAVGLVLAAPVASIARRHDGARRSVQLVLGVVVPAAAIAATWWMVRRALGVTSVYESKMVALELAVTPSWWLSPSTWIMYALALLQMLLHLGLVFAPLAVAVLIRTSRRTVAVAGAFVVVLTAVVVASEAAIPAVLTRGATLSVDELGLARPLIHGEPAGSRHGTWLPAFAMAVGLAGAFGIVAAGVNAARRWRDGAGMGAILVIATGVQLVLVEVLWLYHDRYYLPLVPGTIYLLLTATNATRTHRMVAAANAAVLALISVTGTVDHLRFNGTVAAAHRSLLDAGVPAWHVDAGYPLNGWWLYAHPGNLGPGMRPATDVPFVTVTRWSPYVVANSPLPGYAVMRSMSWRSVWAASNTVFVLQRRSETAGSTTP